VAKQRLVSVVAELRERGIAADLAYGDRGLKGAMKAADRSGARLAILLGDRDLEAGSAQLKDLASGEQEPVPLDELVATVEARIR
jgi:histidyl-tRNA synthetase